MSTAVLTLIGKPGCHLCDEARDVVAEVIAKLAGETSAVSIAVSITVEEKSIFDDAGLLDAYAEEIPVLLINGRVHTIWRVDPVRLRAALLEV